MANEALFLELGKALSRPSKAYRAAQAAFDIPGQALEGYTGGLKAAQDIRSLRMMNTPLGELFPGGEIPYGLSPDHTVGQLLQLAPALREYIPGNVVNSIAQAYNGEPSSSLTPPTVPPNAPTTGAEPNLLAKLEGTGAGQSSNVSPGAPLPVPTAGNSGAGRTPSPVQPGMSLTALKTLEPALNAAREARQFSEGQNREDIRQGRSINAENTRAELSRDAEMARAGGTISNEATAKIAPIDDAINALQNYIYAVSKGGGGLSATATAHAPFGLGANLAPKTASAMVARNQAISALAKVYGSGGGQAMKETAGTLTGPENPQQAINTASQIIDRLQRDRSNRAGAYQNSSMGRLVSLPKGPQMPPRGWVLRNRRTGQTAIWNPNTGQYESD